MMKTTTLRIVIIIASMTSHGEYWPAPKIIGMKPMSRKKPNDESDNPETNAATIRITMPMKIRKKPRRKIFISDILRGKTLSVFGVAVSRSIFP